MSLFSRIFKPASPSPGAAARAITKGPSGRSRMRGWLHVGTTAPPARGLDWGMESALPRLALHEAPARFQR